MAHFIAILFFILVCLNTGLAQHPVSIQIDERDGLPSTTVYDLFQDSLGYIWMGTSVGLVRYDSYSFRHYYKSREPSGAIAGLQMDSRGRLWFVNFNRQMLYLEGDSIKRLPLPELEGLRTFTIRNDTIYLFGSTQMYRYSIHSGKGKTLYSADGRDGTTKGLTAAYRNYSDNLVFTTSAHMLNYWSERGNRTVGHLPEFFYPNTGGWDCRIAVLPDRAFVHGFLRSGFYEYNGGKLSPVDLSPFNEKVMAVFFTTDGLLWFSTNDKLWVTDMNYKPVFEQPILTGAYVTDIILDDAGNYWFSTMNNGVYLIPSFKNTHYSTANSNLADNAIQRIQRGKDNDLYVGLPKGKVAYKATGTHSFINRKLESEQEVQAIFYMPEFESVLVSATITFELSRDLGKARLSDPTTFKEITHDEFGNLWIAGSENVYAYAPPENESSFAEFTLRKELTLGPEKRVFKHFAFGNMRCRSVDYDSTGKAVYVGFADNLVKFSGPDWSQTTIRLGARPIIASDIVCTNGKTYVGTIGDGLVILENDRVQQHYHSANSPLFNYINALAIVGDDVWVGTGNGLYLLNQTSGKWQSFKRSEGLISNEVTDLVAIEDQLWLGTPLGLQSMPAKGFIAQKTVRVHIEKVTIANGETVTNEASLSHAQNDILIQIAGLSYPYNRDAQLEYRLMGQSDHWTRIPASQRQVTFFGLPPGNYKFEIRPAGTDQAAAASIAFFIDKPFWMQTWFILFVATKLSLLLYFVYRQRLMINRRQSMLQVRAAKLEADLRQSELAGIKSQMNPHFIFNALNSIQGYFLEDDKEKANEILGKFSDLIRKILYQSQQSSISLGEEIEALELYLQIEQARLGEEFHFELRKLTPLSASDITIPSMIIQPFVENAVKHGLLHRRGDKWLTVTFSTHDETLHVEIDDNGIGRKQAHRINRQRKMNHQSFAIDANQKRLELLNQDREKTIALKIEDKYDEEGRPSGTRVSLNIPIESNE